MKTIAYSAWITRTNGDLDIIEIPLTDENGAREVVEDMDDVHEFMLVPIVNVQVIEA